MSLSNFENKLGILLALNGSHRKKSDYPSLPISSEEIITDFLSCYEVSQGSIIGVHYHTFNSEGDHDIISGSHNDIVEAISRKSPHISTIAASSSAGNVRRRINQQIIEFQSDPLEAEMIRLQALDAKTKPNYITGHSAREDSQIITDTSHLHNSSQINPELVGLAQREMLKKISQDNVGIEIEITTNKTFGIINTLSKEGLFQGNNLSFQVLFHFSPDFELTPESFERNVSQAMSTIEANGGKGMITAGLVVKESYMELNPEYYIKAQDTLIDFALKDPRVSNLRVGFESCPYCGANKAGSNLELLEYNISKIREKGGHLISSPKEIMSINGNLTTHVGLSQSREIGTGGRNAS